MDGSSGNQKLRQHGLVKAFQGVIFFAGWLSSYEDSQGRRRGRDCHKIPLPNCTCFITNGSLVFGIVNLRH